MQSNKIPQSPVDVIVADLEPQFQQLCADEKWSELLAATTQCIEWRLANANDYQLTVCEDKETNTVSGVIAAENCAHTEEEIHTYNVNLAYGYYFRTVAEVSLLKLEACKESVNPYLAILNRIILQLTSKQLMTIAKQQRYIALLWRDSMPEKYQTGAYLFSILMMREELSIRKSKSYQAAAVALLNESYADLLDLYFENHDHSQLASLLQQSQSLLLNGHIDKKQLIRIHTYVSTERKLFLTLEDMSKLVQFFLSMFILTEASEKLYSIFKVDAQFILVKLLLLQHYRINKGIEYKDMRSKEYPLEDNQRLSSYYQDAKYTIGTQQFYTVMLKLMKSHFSSLREAHENGDQRSALAYTSILKLISNTFPQAACNDRDFGFLASYKFQLIQSQKLYATVAADKIALRALLSESLDFLLLINDPLQEELDLLDSVLRKLGLVNKKEDFQYDELEDLSVRLKAVSTQYHPIILSAIRNATQQIDMEEYKQNQFSIRTPLFRTFYNIVDTCENTLAGTSEYAAIQKIMKKLGISIGQKDPKYKEEKQLRGDLMKAALQNIPHLVGTNTLPVSESALKPSTVRHKPKKVYLTIVQQYKDKYPDVNELEFDNLNFYFKTIGEKKEEFFQHTEKGFIVNLSEIYRYVNKSKPSVFPETDILSLEDIEGCYKGRRIDFDVRNLVFSRYKALLAPKPQEDKASENIISTTQASATPVVIKDQPAEPQDDALESALKLERDNKKSRRDLNQELYEKRIAEKQEAQRIEQEKALALKQQKEEERKRKSQEFAAKKEQDKKDRIEREKQKVIEEKRIEQEIQNTVTPVQKACLDQVFFSLWQIKQLKSRRQQGAPTPVESKESDFNERPVDLVTRHYALLYQLFRCFQMMKTYKEEFYKNAKLKSKLNLKNQNDIYPGLAKLRNRIIHRGAEVVSREDMELVTNDIMEMMPQKFTLKPQNGEASCWNATMTEQQRKEWVCEFGYCNERYKFTEGQLTLEDTDLYKKLEAFHEDLGEKKIEQDEAEKMIAEVFIPKINAIIDAVDNKQAGIVEFQKEHMKNKGGFSHNYFFELQALRMLVTMCGELSGAFAHAKKSEFKSFIEYARSLRNKVGHEVDDVNSEFKLDIAFFSELRARLYYINNKKSSAPGHAMIEASQPVKTTSGLNVKAKAFTPTMVTSQPVPPPMVPVPYAMPIPVAMPSMYIPTPQGFFLNPYYQRTGFYADPSMNGFADNAQPDFNPFYPPQQPRRK